MQVESRLIPILREGIDIVKMVLFKKLRDQFVGKYPERDAAFSGRLSGALINRLFGAVAEEGPFADFARENERIIEEELAGLGAALENMRIPLTDALRIQFLCDHEDGIDSSALLARARDLGVLLLEREVPMPAQFIAMVRRLGGTLGLLVREG